MDLTRLMKQQVGITAAQRVQTGMVVGLGTGSTAAFAIAELGRRQREEGLQIIGVPTSFSAAVQAKQEGLPVRTIDQVDQVDLAIDGADEVDPQRNLIKGGGAAHTLEKIVDGRADSFLVVVDQSKLVQQLGAFPLPVEVLPAAVYGVMTALTKLGGTPQIRLGVKKDGPVITDHGNFVVDVQFEAIPDPAALEMTLNNIPGVLENGLFVGLVNEVLVGRVVGDQVEVYTLS
ncbi:ribose-5-phosphate isomerase RpiA [Candidatus Cyanaurora vandensis]|uniref:ribose-5-phosphate isomerase RpiA n=1 Tax=Candidatus Cyanaurora vandensis TaxID=2714958 RepID=UPI002579D3FF|nr:ribose-5-phosphate isomerase RpiA [Candidatus Cyanaurora vandensis]